VGSVDGRVGLEEGVEMREASLLFEVGDHARLLLEEHWREV